MRKNGDGKMIKKCRSAVVLAIIISLLLNIKTADVNAATKDSAVKWANEQIGKSLDYDGFYGCQSVDLIKHYYETFGAANYAVGNASSYITNVLPPGWIRIYSNYQPGDVAVWKTNHSCDTCITGELGHVGIITSFEGKGFYAVNQNMCLQEVCTKNWFNMDAIECAIRPEYNGDSAPQPTQMPDVYFTEFTTKGITETNAIFYLKLMNHKRSNVTGFGCILYDENDNKLKEYSEGCNYITSYVNYTCNFNVDMDYILTPNTHYKYQIYTVVNDEIHYDIVREFSTLSYEEPTASPTPEPTASPTPEPTASPTPEPTASPTPEPTASPTPEPTASPTPTPTASPTPEPTASPTPDATANPTPEPTSSPTAEPTASPTPAPTANPMPEPTSSPMPATISFTDKLTISSNDNKTATLKWKGSDDITAQKIYRSTKKNGKYKCIAALDGNASSYVDKTIKPLKTYYYKIEAGINNGYQKQSIYSNIHKIKVTGLSTPVMNVKVEKGKNGVRYIVIKMKKCDGKYFEIYVKQKKKYQKIQLTSNLVKKHAASFKLRYTGNNKKLSFKIRTYNVKNKKKIYSNYSKQATVKVN